MKDINSYIMFDGTCLAAMKFYQKCLGGELFTMPYAETPNPEFKNIKDRLCHASLTTGELKIMAGDTPLNCKTSGNNIHLSIDCESKEETQKLFAAFSEKATVTMPLQDTFWGAHFGMLTDQFGIQWMFNFDKK